MTWPAVVFWIALACGVMNRGPLLLGVVTVAASFGTLQMIPIAAAGGLNILPQTVAAIVMLLVILMQPGNMIRAAAAAVDPRRMGLLVAFAVYGVFGAVMLPRLFAGQVPVIPMNPWEPAAVLLYPNSGNLSQAAYMTLSVATAVALSLVAGKARFRAGYPMAVLVGGVAVIGTGLLDLATASIGLGTLLDPFRTASYALLTDTEVLGARRVVGLMPEASAYGALSVGVASALLFLRPCFAPRWRRLVVPAVTGGLVVMAALSTSSTAFVGLGVMAATYGAARLARLGRAPLRALASGQGVVIVGGLFAILALAVFAPSVLAPATDMINATVINKSQSDSYVERSMWTRIAFEAFQASGGLGVGLGSVRTSNWAVAILGSTGVLGAGLLVAFMIRLGFVATRPDETEGAALRRGLGLTLIPTVSMAVLSASTPDIGLGNAIIFGILAGLDERPAPRAAPAPGRRPVPA